MSKEKKEERREKGVRRQGDTKYSFPLTAGEDKCLKKGQGLFAYKLSAAGLSPTAIDYVERCNQEEEREATITAR